MFPARIGEVLPGSDNLFGQVEFHPVIMQATKTLP
jgi:hypothetical protein